MVRAKNQSTMYLLCGGWLGLLLVCLYVGVGCSSTTPQQETQQETVSGVDGGHGGDGEVVTEAPATSDDKSQGQWVERKWTYRIIAGLSMGGGMAAMVGLRNHEKFDIIGTMGAPNDLTYLFYYIEKSMLGGFCDLSKMEDISKQGKLDNREGYCAPPAPPATYPFEFTSHYNDWHYDDAGGNWNRASIVRVLQDLTYALGNPLFYNPKSPYWPHEQIPVDWRSAQDRCNNPIRIKGVKYFPFNPDGKYDLITFCDGNGSERSGVYYPEKTKDHTQPVDILLAVDINGNGKRDYGEPVISMSQERFDDVGVDGCANDREDGKGGCVPVGQKGPGGKDPNGDDYHPLDNPNGTEGNTVYDEGEPFRDDGLDGVPGTKDYGEGDGKFTRSPNRLNLMAHDPRTLVRNMPVEALNRLNVYIDGGIRDLFNFHISALHLLGALRSKYPKQPQRAQKYDRFVALMPPGAKEFDFIEVDWSTKGQHVYIQYGNPDATAQQISQGDGDHVNGGRALDRILAFFGYVSAQLPDPDMKPLDVDLQKGEAQAKHYSYDSKALGFKNIYSVVLPPGFYANPQQRYPVVYFGHGYGMDAPGMASLMAIVATQMAQGTVAKMILVSLHGKCEEWLPNANDPNSFDKRPVGNCHRGVFYLNSKGLNNDGLQFESSVFEVIDRVEKEFGSRIRQPDTRRYRVPVP